MTSKGLDYLSGLHHSAPVDVVSRAGLQHLFRVGASLDRDVVPDFPSDETEPSDTD